VTESSPCANPDLLARIVAIEASAVAFKELMHERDLRYTERAKSQDTAVATAMASAEKAILKAETATEKRLEGLNELKGMAENQAATFARKAEVELAQTAQDKRIDELTRQFEARQSHSMGIGTAFAYFVGACGVLLAVFSLIVTYFHR
jgi:hypothetical protein